jgi:proteic killer suppression protein
MKIDFKNNFLKKCANNDSFRVTKMGNIRSTLFKRRLDELASAETLESVRYLPGHYHELINTRKGQWSVDLDQPYRLIFEPQETPIPVDKNGVYIWNDIKSIYIIEIINYHKEK